jgi:probable rRNA maturation factor
MSVAIRYFLRSGPRLDKVATEETVREVRQLLGFADYDVGLFVTSKRTIAAYNKYFRGKRGPTDVISIPAQTFAGPKEVVKDEEVGNDLGDILLCLPLVAEQVGRAALDERFQLLVCHSMLHLTGYDHEDDGDWAEMQREEARCMEMLGRRRYFKD